MTALTLNCIDQHGAVVLTTDDVALLIAFLCDDKAVISALNEEQADDRGPVDEAPWIQTALAYGDMDLGTRCIISGGEVMEIDTKEANSTDTLPF